MRGELNALLEDVVRKQRPDLIGLLPKAESGALTQNEKRALIDAVSSEFTASGLGSGDEPNERGHLLESLLDRLNARR